MLADMQVRNLFPGTQRASRPDPPVSGFEAASAHELPAPASRAGPIGAVADFSMAAANSQGWTLLLP
jgi:hypothetical protein